MVRNLKNHKMHFNPKRLRQARVIRGLSVTELADKVGVSKQAISLYELGENVPKSEVILSLMHVLSVPYTYFFTHLDEPIVGNTFFRASRSISKKVRNSQKERLNWFMEIFNYLKGYVDFPEYKHFDMTAFEKNFETGSWEDEDIERLSTFVRDLWGIGDNPINNLVNLLERNGIVVSSIEMGNEKLDAFCQPRKGNPVIVLGSDKGSAARRHFDAAHELGHLLMHKDIIEDQEELRREELNELENQANKFASAFLLPRDSFSKMVSPYTTLEEYKEIKKYWKVSIAAMIVRAKNLEIISESRYTSLNKQISMRNIRKKEPLDDIIPIPEPVMLKKAILLLIESGVRNGQEIVNEIGLPQNDLEILANLEKGTLNYYEPEPMIELKGNYKSFDNKG